MISDADLMEINFKSKIFAMKQKFGWIKFQKVLRSKQKLVKSANDVSQGILISGFANSIAIKST